MPIIHKNIEVLRNKLAKFEPLKVQKRIGAKKTVVFAIDNPKYDPNIPLLTKKDIKKYLKRQNEPHSETQRQPEPKPQLEPQPQVQQRTEPQLLPQARPQTGSELQPEPQLGQPPEPQSEPQPQPKTQSQTRTEFEPDLGPQLSPLSSSDSDSHTHQDKRLKSEKTENRLVIVHGPEEDEFRQYDDDDPDEESLMTKNLKKIRPEKSAPLPPPTPARTVTKPQETVKPNPKPQVVQRAEPVDEFKLEHVVSHLEQGNLQLVFSEIDRRKDALKTNEIIRNSLKRAVFMCLEKDETFALLNFIGLVIEFNYAADSKFWDELIGKLKRKDNPHAKCHSFKCKADPTIVLHNYQVAVKRIVNHFNLINPTVTLSWHMIRYLMEKVTPSPQSDAIPPKIEGQTSSQQENLDPTVERDISIFQDTDGKRKFKIKAPRREAKFSVRLLST